jgi:hypothetical protein
VHTRSTHGTAYYEIEFKNMKATPCVLDGYPSVSSFGTNSTVHVGPPATRNPGSPAHKVGLSPEGTATALLRMVNARRFPSRCRPKTVSGILVQPPGLTHSVRLPLSGLTCANPRYHALTVNAVVEGALPPQGD